MMESILEKVKNGTLSVKEASQKITGYEDIGFAKIDHNRKKRQGIPEVIYGEGKTADQIKSIIETMNIAEDSLLVTRITEEKARNIQSKFSDLVYNNVAGLLYKKVNMKNNQKNSGYIAVVCAGTSDLPVAEEAAITAEIFGSNVRRFYDVGVAGIHRLLNNIEEIKKATVSIVIAGMEGALPSVVGGLVSNPVISVPTSIGYGTNFKGLSSLLTMLNSCSSGISVVNIDNGFGGAYNAILIDRIANN